VIKAIETVYNSYRFRSRLEARWAVFFEGIGLHYIYEMEGFDLGALGWYLPDFWFPQIEAFGEVKYKTLTEEQYSKTAGLPGPCLLFDTSEPRAMAHYPAGLYNEEVTFADYLSGNTFWRVLLEASVHKKRLWYSFGVPDEFEFYLSRFAEVTARQARFEKGR